MCRAVNPPPCNRDSPQSVICKNWLMALWIIGPRQIMASSSFCPGRRPSTSPFTPEALRGDHATVSFDGTFGDAEDAGDVGTIDVAVKQRNIAALSGESRGEVDGDGRFADSALFAVHADSPLPIDLSESAMRFRSWNCLRACAKRASSAGVVLRGVVNLD